MYPDNDDVTEMRLVFNKLLHVALQNHPAWASVRREYGGLKDLLLKRGNYGKAKGKHRQELLESLLRSLDSWFVAVDGSAPGQPPKPEADKHQKSPRRPAS